MKISNQIVFILVISTLSIFQANATPKVWNCSTIGGMWRSFQDGACQVDQKISISKMQYAVRGFVFDMRKFNIDLVDSIGFFGEVQANANTKIDRNSTPTVDFTPNYTADEVVQLLPQEPLVVSPVGYPRFAGDPVPRGLLQKDNKVISKFSSGNEAKKFLTAILCLDKKKSHEGKLASAPYVIFVGGSGKDDSTWDGKQCENAIQVGPRIIEKSQQPLVLKLIEKQAENRITLSIGSDYFIYLLYWEKIPLKYVQDSLLRGDFGKSSKPLWAINISMRELAGIRTKEQVIGETDTTNSAFLIFRQIQ